MAQTSTIVTLPQMVDLALNAPEVGAVNFNILHALLHVIIQQQELLECKVEFRGDDGIRLQNLLAASKPGPSINLTEFAVDSSGKARKRKRRGEKSKDDTTSVESSSSFDTVVVVEPTQEGLETPHVSVAVDRNFFENIERDITIMKTQIKELLELPSNQGLIEALQSDNMTPVIDMFQILNLKKRVDSVEEGINKMASILEDIAKGGNITAALSELKGDGETGGAGGIDSKDWKEFKEIIENLRQRMAMMETDGVIKQLKEKEAEMLAFLKDSGFSTGATKDDPIYKDIMDQIASLDCMFSNQVEVFHNQICELEKELGIILEKLNSGVGFIGAGRTGSSDFDEAILAELFQKIAKIEKELEILAERNSELLRDKEEKDVYINSISEQIEFLRHIKANREDMEDALAEKADVCAVNKKVNYDQFEEAYEELNRSIDDTLAKLTQQEALWQQTLDEIQNEIANKLDKADLRPLKDYVNSKLKQLQERLKALAALKRDTEAAGTKSKLLRNVNCISCDKDVVMRKEFDPSLFPPKPTLPSAKSMAPYLAYELDALRKQQRCMPQGRNLNHFENAIESYRKPEKGDHICNRYCGGSHTVTTPQQRVTRMGHFLQQWGPEAMAEEGQIRGTDGQMYKASEIKSSKDEMPDDLSFKTRPSMVVHGDILSARSNLKSARLSEEAKETEVRVTEVEGEKPKKPSTEITERKSSKTPRASKEKELVPSTPKGSSKEIRRSSKGSKEEAEAPGSRRGSKSSKKEPAVQEEESPEGERSPPTETQQEEGSPPEEASQPAQ